MEEIVEHGLYKIKDQYFADFKREHWIDNKNENRPYYYLLKDTDGVMWVMPLSSQTENYKEKIKKVEEKRGEGNCLYYHIGKIAGVDRVFLVGDMFPISEEYIKDPYTIGSFHYVSRDDKLNRQLYSKAIRYLKLVEAGVMKSRNDIMGIKRILMNRMENQEYMA